jgi:predicted nucleic acid-binding protein
MTGEKAPSFVDTNVLVYAFDKSSSPKKNRKVSQRCSREAQTVLEDLTAGPLMVLEVGQAILPNAT